MTKQNNGWISVDERLPEEEQQVIAIINGKVKIAVYGAYADFNYDFDLIDGREWTASWCRKEQVTLWQPLPQPPETE